MESLQIDKQRLGIKPLVKVPKENNKKKRMSIHTRLQDINTYKKATPFSRQ